MNKSPFAAAAATALLALAACNANHEPEVVDTRAPDPMASALANAAPIELPPPVKATVTFRCKDNSLVFVDFFEGDTQANFRATKDAAPVRLKAGAAGEPFVAGDIKVTGTPSSITLVQPGKAELSCKA